MTLNLELSVKSTFSVFSIVHWVFWLEYWHQHCNMERIIYEIVRKRHDNDDENMIFMLWWQLLLAMPMPVVVVVISIHLSIYLFIHIFVITDWNWSRAHKTINDAWFELAKSLLPAKKVMVKCCSERWFYCDRVDEKLTRRRCMQCTWSGASHFQNITISIYRLQALNQILLIQLGMVH